MQQRPVEPSNFKLLFGPLQNKFSRGCSASVLNLVRPTNTTVSAS